jgi:hypothetical protein
MTQSQLTTLKRTGIGLPGYNDAIAKFSSSSGSVQNVPSTQEKQPTKPIKPGTKV